MDYESLKLIWWVLIGVLLIGFAVTDGFDMGVISLLKVIGKTDDERRIMLNAVGPHWDGNQVWFITAGGAIFAAWPIVYAVAFSGLYWALLLVLFALFFRPVGFEYRSKIETHRWRNIWDWLLTVGGAVPALVFGIAFGNLFLGLPFTLNELMQTQYTGSFWQLLSPFALLCGVVSLTMLTMHGAVFLQLKTEDELVVRARGMALLAAFLTLTGFTIAGVWLAFGIDGYTITSLVDGNAVMTPLDKRVAIGESQWLANYEVYPLTLLAPALSLIALLTTMYFTLKHYAGRAFISSSIAVAGIICTAGFSLFPFIMPSSIDPVFSLTVWDVVSSEKTLGIMFAVAAIFVPIVLSYTAWSYYKMWGVIRAKDIHANQVGMY